MMGSTYDAVLQPDGRLQFAQLPESLRSAAPQRVRVTFVAEAAEPPRAPADVASPLAATQAVDWRRYAGALSGTPHWNGEPLAVQEALRREWD